jgi:LPS-assembly lipoprotein
MKTMVFIMLIALITSACGWHLRGAVAGEDALALSAPISLSINTKDDHSPLINSLRQTLSSHKITEVTGPSSDYQLQIGSEQLDKRTAGVGSDALTSAYEIILKVDYQILQGASSLTPINTSASLARTYNYNVKNANGATQEEALILREMRRELAQQLLRRLKVLSQKHAAKQSAIATPAQAQPNVQAAP